MVEAALGLQGGDLSPPLTWISSWAVELGVEQLRDDDDEETD